MCKPTVAAAAKVAMLSGLSIALALAQAPAAAASAAMEIGVDSVGLTADAFRRALTSPDEAVRERAMLYLLGVQDASEGRSWCDYKTLKTITLREFVHEYLKKLPAERARERASAVIEEALNKSFSCKKRPK
jgi:hypothetical protein